MATNNQYELRIVIEDGGGASSQIAGSSGGSGQDTANIPKAQKSTSASLATFVATRAIKPFLEQTKNFLVSNVELITGSTELQQRTDFAMQMIDTGSSIISTTAVGGAIGGPVGLGIGFVVGLMQTATSYLFKQTQINLEAQIEDRQIAYLQNRAGPALNMSRRGN